MVEHTLVEAGYDVRRLSVGTGLIADTPGGVGTAPSDSRRPRRIGDARPEDRRLPQHHRRRRPRVRARRPHDRGDRRCAVLRRPPRPRARARCDSSSSRPRNGCPGGALDVLADGGLVDVTSVIGLHCEPKLDCGTIGLRAGAITSAADMVTIDLAGPGGHTARPELTVDLVSIGARLVTEVPGLVADELVRTGRGADAVKLVFGAIHAGDAANVIPTACQLKASVRTPSLDVWENLEKIVTDAVDRVLDGTGAARDDRLRPRRTSDRQRPRRDRATARAPRRRWATSRSSRPRRAGAATTSPGSRARCRVPTSDSGSTRRAPRDSTSTPVCSTSTSAPSRSGPGC